MASACQRSVHRRSADGGLAPPAFPQTVCTTVHVDSRDRDFSKFPSASEFVFALPEDLRHVSSAAVVAARVPMPNAFSASRGNTSLTMTCDGVTHTVTIPDDDYSSLSLLAFVSYLANLLNAAFEPSISTSTRLGRHVFYSDDAETLSVDTATDRPAEWGLAYYLGFSANVPASADRSGEEGIPYLVAPQRPLFPSFSQDPYVMLHIEELDDQAQGAPTGGRGRRALAKIPLDGDAYVAHPEQAWATSVECRPPVSRLRSLHVSLRHHDGVLVDLGNREWSFTLVVERTLAG